MVNIIKIMLIYYIIIISCTQIEPLLKKKRVLHFGLDGWLQKCLNECRHSMIDLFKIRGSSSFTARTAIQTVSGPGWSNILCGMDTESSGVVDNSWFAPWFYQAKNYITSITGDNVPLPCVFQQIKKQKPELSINFFYSWNWFINLSNTMIPKTLDVDQYCPGRDLKAYIECDEMIIPKVKAILEKDFDYFFVYIGSLDESGHEYRFCSKEYVQRFNRINDIIQGVFNLFIEKGIFDDTYFILNTDHGATDMTTRHGDQNMDNLLVPWMIMGPNIKSNYQIKRNVKNLDITATVCKIFGVEPNPVWKSRSVDEIFIEGFLKP